MKRIIRALYIAAAICMLTGCKKKADPVIDSDPAVTNEPVVNTNEPDSVNQTQGSITDAAKKPTQQAVPTDGAIVVDDTLTNPDGDEKDASEQSTQQDEWIDNEFDEYDEEDPKPTVKPTVEEVLAAEGEDASTVKAGWVSADKRKCLIDQEGTILSIRIENGEVTIQGVINMMTSAVIIPDKIDGKPVTKIAESAFMEEEMSSVVIPDSVTVIGEKAFYECTDLTAIQLPKSLQKVGFNVFGNCTKLETITLDKTCKSYMVENGVLFNKEKTELVKYPSGKTTESYQVPTSVVTIAEGAFSLARNLKKITIQTNVKTIKEEAFAGCTQADFSLPFSLTTIGDYAFTDCYGLKEVVIPSRVDIIPNGAFSGCESLKKVHIKGAVKKIGFAAFSNCVSLSEVKFDSSVDTIGELSFAFCTELKAFTVPAKTTEILDMAFMACTALTIIEIPDSVSYLGTSVFEQSHQVIIIASGSSAAALYAADHNLLCVE